MDLHLAGFWLAVLAVISSLMRVPWRLEKLSSNSSLSLGSHVNVISLLLIFLMLCGGLKLLRTHTKKL